MRTLEKKKKRLVRQIFTTGHFPFVYFLSLFPNFPKLTVNYISFLWRMDAFAAIFQKDKLLEDGPPPRSVNPQDLLLRKPDDPEQQQHPSVSTPETLTESHDKEKPVAAAEPMDVDDQSVPDKQRPDGDQLAGIAKGSKEEKEYNVRSGKGDAGHAVYVDITPPDVLFGPDWQRPVDELGNRKVMSLGFDPELVSAAYQQGIMNDLPVWKNSNLRGQKKDNDKVQEIGSKRGRRRSSRIKRREVDDLEELGQKMRANEGKNCIESLVIAWAKCRYNSGDLFPQEEVVLICRLLDMDPVGVGKYVKKKLGIILQRYAGDTDSSSKEQKDGVILWQLIDKNKQGWAFSTDTAWEISALGQLVASFPYFMVLLAREDKKAAAKGYKRKANDELSTTSTVQAISKLARTLAHSTDDPLKANSPLGSTGNTQVDSAWDEKMDEVEEEEEDEEEEEVQIVDSGNLDMTPLREALSTFNCHLEPTPQSQQSPSTSRRPRRAATSKSVVYNYAGMYAKQLAMEYGSYIEDCDDEDGKSSSQQPKTSKGPGKKSKPPKPQSPPLSPKDLTVPKIMADIDATTHVSSADNRPDISLLLSDKESKSLIFPETATEPFHCMVGVPYQESEESKEEEEEEGGEGEGEMPKMRVERHKPKAFLTNIHEFDLPGYPVPLCSEQWLKQQREKYSYLIEEDPAILSFKVSLVRQVKSCRALSVMRAYTCVGCLNRNKSDGSCKFRTIRQLTKMTLKLHDNRSVAQFLHPPMYASQTAKLKNANMTVAPLLVPDCVEERNVISSGNIFGGGKKEEVERERQIDGTIRTMSTWQEFYCLYMTASTLMKIMEPLEHVLMEVQDEKNTCNERSEYLRHPALGCSNAPIIYKEPPNNACQLCDMCSTTIICNTYFMCGMCGAELCPQCFAEWENDEGHERLAVFPYRTSKLVMTMRAQRSAAPRISICKARNFIGDTMKGKLQSFHIKRQFLRVSYYRAQVVGRILNKVQEVLDCSVLYPPLGSISCQGLLTDQDMLEFTAKIAGIEQRSRQMYPQHDEWELPVLYVSAGELSTAEFSQLWRLGIVIVVRGLLEPLNCDIWKPEYWIREHGDEQVSILDCSQHAQPVGDGQWPLKHFYRLFDNDAEDIALDDEHNEEQQEEAATDGRTWGKHKKLLKEGILKLKDWPPKEDFQTRFATHFKHFMEALPFPEYTHREGTFNLANRLPERLNPPDLGPKMYCAYASNDGEGGVGTTNLHCDMADAVNIMAYASKSFLRKHGLEVPGIWTRSAAEGCPEEKDDEHRAAAVWDIYPPRTVANLRQYINDMEDDIAGDPIHDQDTYLTYPKRRELYEKYGKDGGVCYRVYQLPGDAVFVPAGSAHQVCNYANAIKVAMDFVSPERVEHARQLTNEFRQLDHKHPRNRDALQLGNILLWTFAGK